MHYGLLIEGDSHPDLLHRFFRSCDATLLYHTRGKIGTLEEELLEKELPFCNLWVYKGDFTGLDKDYVEKTNAKFLEFDGNLEVIRGYVYRKHDGNPDPAIIMSDSYFCAEEAKEQFHANHENFAHVLFDDLAANPTLYKAFVKRSWWKKKEIIPHMELMHAITTPDRKYIVCTSELTYYRGPIYRNPPFDPVKHWGKEWESMAKLPEPTKLL